MPSISQFSHQIESHYSEITKTFYNNHFKNVNYSKLLTGGVIFLMFSAGVNSKNQKEMVVNNENNSILKCTMPHYSIVQILSGSTGYVVSE